ncbi:MAG TPA: alpha/beta hydrolase [Phycisphaerae bacterium]|nr:alpha/beta hydrolase [Phycisphaerae bacterium]
MCYPFSEERKCSARVATLAARRFCEHGYHVLRFDYTGTGESDGWPEQVSIGRWLQDIHTAAQHLAKRAELPRIGLFGIRFGGTLAALCDRVDLSCLLLWAPLLTGAQCLAEYRRHLDATRILTGADGSATRSCPQPEMDMGGFRLTRALRDEIESIELPADARARADTVVVMQMTSQRRPARPYVNVASRLLANPGTPSVLACASRPFWVTASRYDPARLVEQTLKALHMQRRGKSAAAVRE